MPGQTAINQLVNAANNVVYNTLPQYSAPPLLPDPDSAIITYRLMRQMYDSNNLYESLAAFLYGEGIWKEAIRELRCPANRIVEFYAAKLCPGEDLSHAFPVESVNGNADTLTPMLHIIWKNSNLMAKKQVYARWFSIYGDGFIKVVGRKAGPDPLTGEPKLPKVFFQFLEPETMTEIREDERGFLTYVRKDTPTLVRNPKGEWEPWTETEVWDLELGKEFIWVHEKDRSTPLDQLGTPTTIDIMAEHGIDFIPIVHTKFRDVGDIRGSGAFMHAFTKIVEADREATRLASLIFRHNDVVWALSANAITAGGVPLAPPVIDGMPQTAAYTDSSTVTMAGETMVRLPGNASLEALIPNIDYNASLNVLKDMMRELEQDLPEMRYSRIQEFSSDLSSWAIRILLSVAIDRCLEARQNFFQGLIRADMMALTIGSICGVEGISVSPDAFANGELEHFFTPIPVIPSNGLEDAQAEQAQAQSLLLLNQLGLPRSWCLEKYGIPPEKVKTLLTEWDSEKKQDMELAAASQFAGNNTQPNQQQPGAGAQTKQPVEAGTSNGRSNGTT